MKSSRRSHLNKYIERIGGKLVLTLGLREGSRTIAEQVDHLLVENCTPTFLEGCEHSLGNFSLHINGS